MAEFSPGQPLLAVTTEADQQRAQALARQVLEQRLAACVTLTPLRSLYRWQGAIESASEVQLLFKTDSTHLAALQELVQRLHSYSCPEWLHWPASASPTYGQWLGGELAAPLSPDAAPPDAADPPAAAGRAG
jgi:periplasmic divalent cation tolerance protein